MSWEYVGACMQCGKIAFFREPSSREYTCQCGDVGIKLNEQFVSKGKDSFIDRIPTSDELYALVTGIVKGLNKGSILKNRAAGSEAYSCPGSRPESPPGGRAPKGPSRGNSCQSLPTLDAFSAIIEGVEALRDRGKLNEERLRTIVSELITLIYRDQANDK